MLQNYLKVILRNVKKNKIYALINIFGLALAYASFVLVITFLLYESSFENFHTNSNRTYRVTYDYDSGNEYAVHWARVPVDYINELPNEFPQVSELIRFQNHERKYIVVNGNKFRPEFAYQTDPEVFKVFNLRMANGNPELALKEPFSVVITEKVAQKYFGTEEALGQDLAVLSDWNPEETNYKITGIIEDLPSNTHLPIDMLFSFNNAEERSGWAYVYIMLENSSDIDNLKKNISEFIKKYADESSRNKVNFDFQPLQDIHLHSKLAREIIPNGDIKYVRLFLGIGIFLLVIGLINYTNLSSAMAIGRVRENCLRQILGAGKGQVFSFVFIDAFFFHLTSAMVAIMIVFLAFPYFRSLTGIELIEFPSFLFGAMAALFLACILLTMLYPLALLQSFNPVDSLKRTGSMVLSSKSRSGVFKSILITFQYAISILLIGSAFVAADQFKFLNESNLIISKEQILAIPAVPDKVRDGFEPFRDQLLDIPTIQTVTACMEVPSREIRDAGPVLVKGVNTDPDEAPVMDIQVIDDSYLTTLDIQLLAGHNLRVVAPNENLPEFNEEYTYIDYLGDKPRSYLINETAMKQLGWQSPEEALGQEISWSISNIELGFGPIVGVIKDFHQESMKNFIDPTILLYEPVWLRTFLVKLSTNDMQQTVSSISNIWDELFPQYPMEFHFLDDMYNELYQSDRVKLELLYMLCALAVFIALIGLFALVACALKTRVKEIALRKVLGADLPRLILLIGKDYFYLLGVASLFAIPLSYYFVNDWLRQFAYRTEIAASRYLVSVALIGFLVLVTIVFQTIRTSIHNPAEILREE